jgi:cytochrome o ubiquinol oxidase operon protein cyoD
MIQHHDKPEIHNSANSVGNSGGSVLSYTIGFALSIIFTLMAYYVVVYSGFSQQSSVAVIIGLAIVQLLVQLLFFLHMGRESKPQWNLMVFYFMLVILGIVVVGSLWIMKNLDYNMMPSHDVDQKMMQERDKGF